MRTPHDRRARRGIRPLLALAALTAAMLSAAVVQTASAASPVPASSVSSAAASGGHQASAKKVCAAPTSGHAACMALVRTDVQGVKADALAPGIVPAGYGPSDLHSAYNLSGAGDAGETIAIVDAYDDPNAESDLAAYRAQYGLPACTTANGCFRKVPIGSPAPNAGWGAEISLDLDMVSAIAPNAHILLVEATTASMADLGTAENQAVALGARFVSNSWGAAESSSDTSFDNAYFNHPGVAITVSSGDGDYISGTEYPAASQYVTAVGGTSLTRASNARGWSESVWNSGGGGGTGSGCSSYDPKPSWQTDTGCGRRTVADVSAVADPATGVAVYDSYGSPGWQVYGGTSAASPIIAAVYALAGTPGRNDRPAQYPYHTTALNDVTTGSNGTCSPSYLCTAGPGYDGPTGLGTPNGVTAFAPAPGPNVLKAPSFEGATTGWQPFIPAGGSVNVVDYNTATGAPATAHDGSWYLAFNTNTGGGSVYQDVSVNAAAYSSWTATAWLAAQSGTVSGQLCVWALGPNVNVCKGYTVGTGYTQVQVVLSVPSSYGGIRFQVYPNAGGGTTDLDSTSLIPSRVTAGSFEQSAAGWQRFVPAGNGVVNMSLYNTTAGAPAISQDGTGYLAFNTNIGGGSIYQDVPTADPAGTTYTAIAWLSSQSGTATGTFCVWGLQPNTNTCSSYSVTSGTYTQVKLRYTTPQANPTLRFQVYPAAGTTDMDTASILTVS